MEPRMNENVKVTVDQCFNMIENRIRMANARVAETHK